MNEPVAYLPENPGFCTVVRHYLSNRRKWVTRMNWNVITRKSKDIFLVVFSHVSYITEKQMKKTIFISISTTTSAQAFQLAPRLHLDSHNFLLAGSFFCDGNVAQPFTSSMCGCLFLFFHEEDLQSATAHTNTVIFTALTVCYCSEGWSREGLTSQTDVSCALH